MTQDDDLTVLKSSLVDRANALGSYLGELKADLGRSDQGFGDALDICRAYTRGYVKQLNQNWNEAASREERREALQSNLKSFLDRERWIDQRFARSSQGEVPRALKTIARQEFSRHDLQDHEPVLTVGPPDSFETHLGSLDTYLFEDLHVMLDEEDEALRSKDRDISIFCAPYIEGTRVLWYPIVLGHEIAHIRLERSDEAAALKRIVSLWLQPRDPRFSAALDELVGEVSVAPLAKVVLHKRMLKWAAEIVCDLNAVRLFGPAGLSAIAEFLSIIESQTPMVSPERRTHPPLPIRLEALFRYLEKIGWDESTLPDFAKVWRAQLSTPREENGSYGADASLLGTTEQIDQLIEFADRWGHASAVGERLRVMEHVAHELLDGVPGATHLPNGEDEWPKIRLADVVNATWMARMVLDRQEGGKDSEHRGALIDGKLEPAEKRRSLDSLASKAIDTLELRRLWTGKRGIISPREIDVGTPFQRPPGDSTHLSRGGSGGVLSRRAIASLLTQDRAVGAGSRMVVTPLYEDSVQDAAVDLRLGPDFIVFRHSATTAFDPLVRDGQDPRTMQEQVHKGWGERFVLHPQELVLASTLEYIVLPDDVAAQVLTRSSYGRLGLLTATAVQVQPGSRGCITLELVNQGETPISLAPGVRVAQLMMWSVIDPSEVVAGKYWFPVGPEFSKVSQDEDAGSLSSLAEITAEAPEVNPTLVAQMDASEGLVKQFYDLALSLGATEVWEGESGSPSSARLGPELAAVFVGVAISVRILAATLQRWIQGRNPGVTIEVEDGRVLVRVDKNLPQGMIVIHDPHDEIKVHNLALPPDTADDVAKVLRAIIQGGGGAGDTLN